MKILIVASDKAELSSFPGEYIRCVSGTGPVMAAAAAAFAIAEHHPDIIFSAGSAGSLGAFVIGDVVSFGSVVYQDGDLTAFHLPPGAMLDSGRRTVGALSLDRSSEYVLSTSARFAMAPSSIDADAADMEAYGVAYASYSAGIPCFAVKCITDIVGEKPSIPDYSFRLRKMRELVFERIEEIVSSL